MKLTTTSTLHRTITLVLCLLISATLLNGCGLAKSLLGTSGGSVAQLWPDVPPIDGATKTELEMPLAFRLMLQSAFKGGIDYIAYSTSKTPDEVRGFYTTERMQANGWKGADMSGAAQDQLSCIGDQSGDASSSGALCLFAKQDGAQKPLLAIVVAQNEDTKQTEVFYARIDVSKLETPTPR
jgi:hypothetical protein